MIGKSCPYILVLAHWSRRAEILQDKIISTNVHKCPLGQKTYSSFPLLQTLRSTLIKQCFEKYQFLDLVHWIAIFSSFGGKLIYMDHTEIETFTNASLRDPKTIPHLMKLKQEFSFSADHIDRRHNEISFLKCQLFKNNNICQQCTENPPKACEAFQYESSFGGVLPDSVKSEKYPGHYKTYLESSRDCDKNTKDNDTEHKRCTMCSNWIFSSATKKNHTHVKVGHTSEFPNGIYWWTLKNPKNQNFENMKKITGEVIILYTCTKNHNHTRYSCWDTE